MQEKEDVFYNKMLENYHGYLQTDGYAAYTHLKNQKQITLLACMAHARRKFEHAKDNDPARSEEALLMFQKLYDIERTTQESNFNFDQVKELRQQKALPVLHKMEAWFNENIYQTLPKSAIGQAITVS